jgi:hypothetical protein
MGNWDLAIRYDERATSWLTSQELPHPRARSQNRHPTTSDIIWALQETGYAKSPPVILIDGIDWNAPQFAAGDGFTIRGDRLAAIRVLKKLAQRCGQIWLYPDTGEPAIVVDESTDPESIFHLHAACTSVQDSWEKFYRKAYGAQPKD